MFAVIGLGNPGSKYQHTRHNLGFWALDALADRLGKSPGSWQLKGACDFLKCKIGGDDVLLLRPLQFMNLSGQAARPLLSFFKIEVSNVIVIYDELDFDPGVVRLRKGGSAGGHRGVQDLIAQLGSPDFYRIRIGIGHPRRLEGAPPIEVSDWVLTTPRGEEADILRKSAVRSAEAAEVLLTKGLEAAQQEFH